MTNRSQAKRITLGAQVASLVLVAAAVGVAALGLPVGDDAGGFTPVEVSLPTLSDGGQGHDPDGNVPNFRRVDFPGIVERFGLVGNAPGVKANPGAGEPGPGTLITPAGGPSGDETRYLGMIQIGARRSAMLVIDGKQRIVSQGGQATNADGEAIRVLNVQPDYVTLNENGTRTRVEKGVREMSAVTTIERTVEDARRANEAANRLNPPNTGEPGSGENPRVDFERRRREAIDRALDEGRITQEEAQRMLDRINNAANRRGRDD